MCLRESTFHHLPCLPSPYHSVCSRLYWWVQLRAPDINGRINWVCISNVLQQTTCERETETEIDHQLPTAPSQFINQEMRSSVLSSSKISFPNRKWKMQPANASENFPPTAQSTSLFPASCSSFYGPRNDPTMRSIFFPSLSFWIPVKSRLAGWQRTDIHRKLPASYATPIGG